MTLLEFAQTYTKKMGWSVIPCVAKGKASLVPWKQYQDHIAPEYALREWFSPGWHAPRNLAIITGDVSGRLLVLDFDRYDLFIEWFHCLRLRTLAVRTGKGVHLYFKLAEREPPLTNRKFYVNGLRAGDIRYNGGFVVAPPSVHPSGRLYEWSRASIRTVTLASLQLEFRERESSSNVRLSESARPPMPDYQKQNSGEIRNLKNYALGALRGEVDRIWQTGNGGRNDQLYRSALKLSKYAEILGEDLIEIELTNVAIVSGLSRSEAWKTVKSGLRNGMENGVLKAVL